MRQQQFQFGEWGYNNTGTTNATSRPTAPKAFEIGLPRILLHAPSTPPFFPDRYLTDLGRGEGLHDWSGIGRFAGDRSSGWHSGRENLLDHSIPFLEVPKI